MGKTAPRGDTCPIVETARLIGGKWDLIIIRYLLDGPKRFSELRTKVPDLSSKSLSITLKQLATKGLIQRKVNSSPPISVVYSLTGKGHDMRGIVEAMRRWGERWSPERSLV